MKRAIIIAAMLAAAGLAGAQMFAQLFSATETEPNYVTSGLLLRLDGIKNTRAGHNASATTWEDLSGNGKDVPILGATVEDTCWNFSGANVGGVLDWKPAFTAGCTIEVVTKTTAAIGGTAGFVGIAGWGYAGAATDRNALYYESGSIVAAYGVNFRSVTASAANISYFSATDYKIWTGATLTTNTLQFSRGTMRNKLRIGAYGNTSDADFSAARFTGRIYAVRVYGRVLSDAEIAQNYAADKARFGL